MSDTSGLDELKRISQRLTKAEAERSKAEKQRAERQTTIEGALRGLREIKVSVALEQLKPVATSQVITEVNSLKHKPGTEDLRKLISELTDDLEKRVSKISARNPEMVSIERSVKTLTILIDLFFSLQ